MITITTTTKSKQTTAAAAKAMGRIIDGPLLSSWLLLFESEYDVFVDNGFWEEVGVEPVSIWYWNIVDDTGWDVIFDVERLVMVGAVDCKSCGAVIYKIFQSLIDNSPFMKFLFREEFITTARKSILQLTKLQSLAAKCC